MNYTQKVQDSFNRQKFMHYINAQLLKVAEGYCEILLPHSENLTQQHGFFHAGIISTLADNAAGYAAFSTMAENSSVLSVEYKINLLAPAQGEYLVAKAEVIKAGKTLTICQSKVYGIKNEVEKLCAIAQVTLIELKNKPDNS